MNCCGSVRCTHRFPSVLPDGRSILFTIKSQGMTTFDGAKVAALSLDTGRWHVVVENASRARYVPTGHLVWAHDGRLLAAPFDANLGGRTPAGDRRLPRRGAEPADGASGNTQTRPVGNS